MLITYILVYMTLRLGRGLNYGYNCRSTEKKEELIINYYQSRIFKHSR